MSNKIMLHTYRMSVSYFMSELKKKATSKKKLVFNCELYKIFNNDAYFGLVCYPANKKKGKWQMESSLKLINDTTIDPLEATPPIMFGNNEIIPGPGGKKKPGSIYRKIRYMLRTKKSVVGMDLIFTPKISKNPHVTFDVTIGSSTEAANPSPPADPR